MKRRNFLIGASGTAIGASALIGTGAFSRVESDRHVSIEVAEDPDAYLGLSPIDTPNSDNYVDLDDNGHLEIDIGENPNDGEGVNSNSTTWFDGLFKVCNQGKETAGVYIEDFEDEHVDFYRYDDEEGQPGGELSIVGKVNTVELETGECMEVGIRTETHGVDANDGPLFDQDVQFIADVDIEPAMLVLDGDSEGLPYNEANAEEDRPYIDWEIDGTVMELTFENPTTHAFAWDYRVDGAPDGTPDQWTDDEISEGPLEGEKFGERYEGVTVVGPGSETVTVQATQDIEVILRRGAEQMWYVPWITFEVQQ